MKFFVYRKLTVILLALVVIVTLLSAQNNTWAKAQDVDSANIASFPNAAQLTTNHPANNQWTVNQTAPLVASTAATYNFVDGFFGSGVVSTPLQSANYQLIVTAGGIGLPSTTTISSSNYQHQPGFLAGIQPGQLLVTIKQAGTQPDPTSVSPINFIATFSKPINLATFTNTDITLGGTAGATIATISQIAPNNGTTFNIAISGMTKSGTVTAFIAAAKVTDPTGNINAASTSTDNSVTYNFETDTTCLTVPSITPKQDQLGNLVTPDDIDLYKFNVDTAYTTIVAILTPPVTGDFAVYLYDKPCVDGPVNTTWGEIGRRYIHIGRRYIHLGPSGNDSKTEIRFNVGTKTGTYYLGVVLPQDGTYNAGQYKLYLDLQKPNFSLMNTLILYNPSRLQKTYDLVAASEVMDKLTQLAANPKVNGIILKLDQFTNVTTAYTAWDAAKVINGNENSYNANVAAANSLSDQIRIAMVTFMKQKHILTTGYVVVIGDDGQIPFRRLAIHPDPIIGDARWMDERSYFQSLAGEIATTPTDAALMANQTLSDDFYGDYTERPWVGNLPILSVGRLMDTPARIQKAIDKFLAVNGQITLTAPTASAAVAGYDVLTDSAQQACADLASSGLTMDCSLITASGFSGNDLNQKFIVNAPNIAAHYGHTNHEQLVAANNSSLDATQISAANFGSNSVLWWVIGCQSGLTLPSSENHSLSLAQALGDQGTTYVGNTGWAWASDGPLTHSELLYQLFADNLTQTHPVTIGQALRLAKRNYFSKTINNPSNLGTNESLSYYDAKVMAEATLYGLPMLQIDFPVAALSPAVAPNINTKQNVTNQALPAQMTLWLNNLSNITVTSKQSNSNTYYVNSQDKYGIAFKANTPVLPLSNYLDFKTGFGRAKGVIWIGGAYTQTTNNPLIVTPRQLNGAPVAEAAFNGTYPLLPITLTSLKGLDNVFTNNMTFQLGQYRGNQISGVLRLFNQIDYLVSLWNGASTDDVPPVIENPIMSMNSNLLHLQLPVTDTSGIYKVYLTYTPVNNQATSGTWKSIQQAGTCTAGRQIYNLDLPLPTTGVVDYFIQVMDCAGNVSVKMNNGKYYQVNTLGSIAAQDGWILEFAENSSLGGTLDSTSATFNIGDNAANKQALGILHFDTASLPDNAVITSAMLKIMKQGLVGTNPFTTHGSLVADIRKLFFGPTAALEIADFQAPANKPAAAIFNATPIGNWYSATLASAAYPFINLTGTTQLRLRFSKDDNDNLIADYLSFFSGSAPVANRPTLIIQYYVP